jgi:hypothetical protein
MPCAFIGMQPFRSQQRPLSMCDAYVGTPHLRGRPAYLWLIYVNRQTRRMSEE